MTYQTAVKYIVPPASYLPFFVLGFLTRHWPLFEDDSVPWDLWMDANYYKHVRKHGNS